MGSMLENFCPVNIYRPTFPEYLSESKKIALIKVYNDAITKDLDKFNHDLKQWYSLENVRIEDYYQLLEFYNQQKPFKDMTLKQGIDMNIQGCVLRTSKELYSGICDHSGDGGAANTKVSINITIFLIVSCFTA
ncbi:hypothetical protein BdWA1_000483 [Babesia duncani]|uniref:Uncharacterized protein n=1 Tax=Babesia duncani TaxID=323732 RepID=A0AAD9UPV4_9APIC|nr:hypothetical protein BdWA1_000483 [Babesia duncani]